MTLMKMMVHNTKYYCSIHEGFSALGRVGLMLNCLSVASRAAALPLKYAEMALWNSSSCLCITLTCARNNRIKTLNEKKLDNELR